MLSNDEYKEIREIVTKVLNCDYSYQEKHRMAVRFERSGLFKKFLESIQFEYVDKRSQELVSKVLDCLEY